ncbi:Acyl carrier protein [Chlamydia avium 10DC88]|uniref:Acyl carrier protein n=2 Tax=Chlamydia avium TaxID=1457141 RepID=W8JLM8_9CHLA|nr:Acyl carrier protein [Chlamydia avium 10DC88]
MVRNIRNIAMSLEDDVKAIIVDQLGVDISEVNEDSSFIEDLNADSLDLTELIMSLEEKFSFEISEEEAEKLRTVGDVIAYIKMRQGQQ